MQLSSGCPGSSGCSDREGAMEHIATVGGLDPSFSSARPRNESHDHPMLALRAAKARARGTYRRHVGAVVGLERVSVRQSLA
jgi:hypothetical protein